MHPIEHLRYVARAQVTEPTYLAREAATALASLRADHPDFVVACRRIVERHPEVGQLWWLCARLLVAADPSEAAWELAERLEDEAVSDVVAAELHAGATVVTIGFPVAAAYGLAQRPDVTVRCAAGELGAPDLMRFLDRHDVGCEPVATDDLGRAVASADAVLIEARAASTERLLVAADSQVVAALARAAGTPVWLVTPTGTRLPPAYVDSIAGRAVPAATHGRSGSIDEVPRDLVDVVITEAGRLASAPESLRADCPFAPELLRSGLT